MSTADIETDQVLLIQLLNDVYNPVNGEETAWFVRPASLLGDIEQFVE